MRNLLLTLSIFIFTTNLKAQTYELLNDIFSSTKNEKVHLKSDFESLNNEKFLNSYLTENFIKDNWEPLPSIKTPDSSLFFNNVKLEHLRFMVVTPSSSNQEIDFKKLKESFVRVSDLDEHFKENDTYQVVSKPLFSCNNQWAVIYRYTVFKSDVGNSGTLYIYRKIDENWVVYHKITLWMS
jgi:hypothetical protein